MRWNYRGEIRNGRDVSDFCAASFLRAAVECHFAVNCDGDVAAARKKLHYAFPGAGESSPAGLGFGVLLQAAQVLPVELEIYLKQTALRGAAHGIFVAGDFDGAGLFDQGLPPDGNQRFFQRHGDSDSSSMRGPLKQKGTCGRVKSMPE